MDEKNYVKLTMNPTRQRILQTIIFKGKVSTGDLANELSDIPIATLYRNIKVLYDNEIIKIVDKKAIRGVVQNYYEVNEKNVCEANSNFNTNKLFQSCIYEISRKYNEYFKEKEADAIRDKISISSATLLLSDKEVDEFSLKLQNLIAEYSSNQRNDERKERTIVLMSLPNKGNE